MRSIGIEAPRLTEPRSGEGHPAPATIFPTPSCASSEGHHLDPERRQQVAACRRRPQRNLRREHLAQRFSGPRRFKAQDLRQAIKHATEPLTHVRHC
jgi:hypothetical protein